MNLHPPFCLSLIEQHSKLRAFLNSEQNNQTFSMWNCDFGKIAAIPVELGFLWHFEVRTIIRSQDLNNFFFSLWHHGGCRRPFPFLWYECYLTTIVSETKNVWNMKSSCGDKTWFGLMPSDRALILHALVHDCQTWPTVTKQLHYTSLYSHLSNK